MLDWEECTVEYPLPEDGQKQDKVTPIIKQFDKALEEHKLVAIYLYTDDMRKKFEAKTKLCESYFDEVLCTEKVGEKLKSCLRLKLNVSKLDDSKLKKAYKFSKSYPAIYFYDFEGNKIKSTTSRDENTVISYISYSEKKIEKLVEKLEKKAEKEAEKKEE